MAKFDPEANSDDIILFNIANEIADLNTNTLTLISLDKNYAIQVDTTSVTDVIFFGQAEIASATSSAVWQIQKIDTSGGDVAITWADGNDSFDNVYDDRTSLTYT